MIAKQYKGVRHRERTGKYSQNMNGERLFGTKKCYDYIFNKKTRPSRAEFSKVINTYSELIQDNIIKCGKTSIPHIGTFYIVKTRIKGMYLDKYAMEEYKRLYPNRSEREFYIYTDKDYYQIKFIACRNIPTQEVVLYYKPAFIGKVLDAARNKRIFTYKD